MLANVSTISHMLSLVNTCDTCVNMLTHVDQR